MTISERIRQLREKKRWNQKELAAKLNLRQSSISAWETGLNGPNPTQRERLCKLFSITPNELYGIAPASIKEDVLGQKIPVISWANANQFKLIADPFPAGLSKEYVYSSVKGERVFALRVQNDCMEPEFRAGDIIIIKPADSAASGDYIIIADRASNTAAFKQLKQYGDKIIGHPLNPKYDDSELDYKKQYVIVGRVVEKIKKY